LTFAQHFRAHYLPYQRDIRVRNRRRRGGHYGTWADEAHQTAYLVTKLRFIPIRYVQLHPQLNPYVPAERALLEKRIGALQASPEPPSSTRTNPDYGMEWETLRQAVLEEAGHRCQQCGHVIKGRNAHVHHRRKRRRCTSRKQANLLENLVALCPRCHRSADGPNND
jgi:hypothetical protein